VLSVGSADPARTEFDVALGGSLLPILHYSTNELGVVECGTSALARTDGCGLDWHYQCVSCRAVMSDLSKVSNRLIVASLTMPPRRRPLKAMLAEAVVVAGHSKTVGQVEFRSHCLSSVRHC
jgi:hypothetical protein